MRDYLNISFITSILLLISYLSLSPISTPSTGLPLSIIAHFVMYFSLAAALLVYFHEKNHTHLDAVIFAGITGLFFELVQSQLGYRTFSFFDTAINFAGAGLVLVEQKVPVVHQVVKLEDQMLEKIFDAVILFKVLRVICYLYAV